MNATKLFALTVLTAAAGAAFAGDGVLIRYGEGSGHYAVPPSAEPSTTGREAVKEAVAQARATGTLLPAGAATWGRAMYDTPSKSTLARADVKAQVMQARLDGTLLPTGEAAAFSGPRAFRGTSIAQAGIGR